MEQPPSSPPWSPLVEEQVEVARSLYEGLLPEGVRIEMGKALGWILERHPAAMGLMRRISPRIIVDAAPDEDDQTRLARGRKAVNAWRQGQSDLRKAALAGGAKVFVLPDTSAAALVVFLAWAGMPEHRWIEAPPEIMRFIVREVSDAVMAVQLVGLLQALDDKPKLLLQWGDVGRALGEALPRVRAVRRGAMARLGPIQRKIFEAYPLCGWDARRCALRLRMDEAFLVCVEGSMAFRALGIAFRTEITGEDDGAGEETFR